LDDTGSTASLTLSRWRHGFESRWGCQEVAGQSIRIALPTRAFALRRIIGLIDRYNRIRRHSHCGLQAHITYEKITTPAANAA